jgi:hypothetical protein
MPKQPGHPHAPQRFGSGQQNPGIPVGMYVPSDHYVPGCPGTDCLDIAKPLQSACDNKHFALGACGAGYGLDSDQMFPAAYDACDGFDNVLVSAPLDLLWADTLLDSDTVLSNNRNQSRDLRGDIPIPAIQGCYPGTMGPFAGAWESSIGPYEYLKSVRTHGPV